MAFAVTAGGGGSTAHVPKSGTVQPATGPILELLDRQGEARAVPAFTRRPHRYVRPAHQRPLVPPLGGNRSWADQVRSQTPPKPSKVDTVKRVADQEVGWHRLARDYRIAVGVVLTALHPFALR